MANPDHIRIFRKGIAAWNRWRDANPNVEPDLSGAILLQKECWPTTHDLVISLESLKNGIDFSYANLAETQFWGFNFSRANFFNANLSESKFSDVWLIDASFRNANLARAEVVRCSLEYSDFRDADLTDATLDGCGIFGNASWGVKGVPQYQRNLRMTKSEKRSDSDITVDNLEIAQFIHLVLQNEKIKDFIETATKKFVLLLGRFNRRKRILDAIRDDLRKHNYLPILFEFKKPSSRDLSETVLTLAGLSRFIIVDITSPRSVPHELCAIVPALPSVPVMPLLEKGYKPYALFKSIQRRPSVLPILKYENVESILADFKQKVIEPAEQKAKELQASS